MRTGATDIDGPSTNRAFAEGGSTLNLLEAMRVFVRVVERGSISCAARDLELGQPTVSERIDRLEQYLGCRLLLRSTRAFKCTPEGEVFYECSKRTLEAATLAVAEVTQAKSVLGGRVRIAAPHCIGETLVPEAMRRLHAQCPELGLDLVLNDRIVDLVTEGVDVSLRLGPSGEGAFVACRLGCVERVLVATPDCLARRVPIREPVDLVSLPFLRVRGIFDNEVLPLLDGVRRIIAAPIRTAMTTSHWRPMYEMVLSGMGLGVVEAPACAQALRAQRLVRVLPEYEVPPLDLNLLVQARRPFPPRVRTIVDALKQLVPELLRSNP